MKRVLLAVFSSVLNSLLKKVLVRLKPLFLIEDERLKKVLSQWGFHLALYIHPSILYGVKLDKHISCRFLRQRLFYLKKCIKLGLLKDERGHRLMRELGMQPYFGNGVDFWFEESHSPIIPYHLPDNPKPKGKIAVYTALTGDYDNVHEVLFKEDGVDYLLFTNNPTLKSKTWKIVYVNSDLDNQLLSREIKMLTHKYLGDAYEASIYIDANAVIYGEISELTRYLDDRVSFAVSRHGERTTVREEIEAIHNLLKIDKIAMLTQYNNYCKNGFQDNIGLAECSILVRRHHDVELKNVMEFWWHEFNKGVRRDQISLMPSIQYNRFDGFVLMDGYVRQNQFCKIISHKV